MNSDVIKEAFQRNWFLIVIGVAVLGGGVFLMLTSPEDANVKSAVEEELARSAMPDEPLETDSAGPPPEAAEAEKTLATIAEHQKKLDAAPQAEDAPALLNAMGNLYLQKLGDYKEAARCYDLLLVQYPRWDGIASAYIQSALCYQRLGDTANEQRIYKDMMKVFPEDAQEYLYAKQQLGL